MITIVDYKAANLASVQLALESCGAAARASDSPDDVAAAERLVFPGVGAAGAAMANLKKLGLAQAIKTAVGRGVPFLGICLGAQIILEFSEEDGGVPCLGLLKGCVRRFAPAAQRWKIPHMGWNNVKILKPHPLFAGIPQDSEFYFVHSYYPLPAPQELAAAAEYAETEFAAAFAAGNIAAVQFHPEKSGRIGLMMLKNFADWNGAC